jgi:hypothetical protein
LGKVEKFRGASANVEIRGGRDGVFGSEKREVAEEAAVEFVTEELVDGDEFFIGEGGDAGEGAFLIRERPTEAVKAGNPEGTRKEKLFQE